MPPHALLLWLGLGAVLHGLLVGPAVAGAGLLLATALPRPWRRTSAAASVATGAVLLVAVPALTRPAAGRAYLPQLLVCLAVVWGVLLAGTVLQLASGLRRGRPYPRPHRLRYDDPEMYRHRSH